VRGMLKVVVEVFLHEDRHQVGGRHRGRGVARSGGGRRANAVHAELLCELVPLRWRSHDSLLIRLAAPHLVGDYPSLESPESLRPSAAVASAAPPASGERPTVVRRSARATTPGRSLATFELAMTLVAPACRACSWIARSTCEPKAITGTAALLAAAI